MNFRAELELRYPSADFSAYFRFLEACRGTLREAGRTQEHHICPKKQFPEFEDVAENLMTLRIDDHAHAHLLLGAAVPELRRTKPSWLIAMSKQDHAKGGRAQGQRHKENKTGVCGRSAEKMSADGRKAGSTRSA